MIRASLALVATALLIAGCRTPIPELPADIELGERLADADPRPSALLSALEDRRRTVSALRGRAHLSLESPDLRFRRPQRLALERPDRLRFEILGLFSQTAAVLVTREGRYQFLDAGSGERSAGPASRALLWDLVRVDLAPAEIVALALGAPLLDGSLRYDGAEHFEGDRLALRFVASSGALRRRLWFDAEARLLRLEVFDTSGKRESDVRWRDHRPLGGVQAFAREVDLLFPRVEARAQLRFSAVELSESLPAELFELPR